MVDIVDPQSGRTYFKNFRKVSSPPYTSADDAYNQWASALGVSAATSNVLLNQYPGYTELNEIPLQFASLDSEISTAVVISSPAILQFYKTVPVDKTTYYNYGYGLSPTTIYYMPLYSVVDPVLSIGALTNITDVCWCREIKVQSTPSDCIIIASRVMYNTFAGSYAKVVRTAYRIRTGFIEIVSSNLSLPPGSTASIADVLCYVDAYGGSSVYSATTFDASFTGTVNWISDDIGRLHPVVIETVGVKDWEAQQYNPNTQGYDSLIIPSWNLSTTAVDDVYANDLAKAAMVKILADTIGLTESLLRWDFRPSAVVTETINVADTMVNHLTMYQTLTDVTKLHEAISLAYPAVVSDAVVLTDLISSVAALTIIDRLRVQETVNAPMTYYKTMLDNVRMYDEVRRFFGGDITDSIGVADALIKQYRVYPAVVENVGLAEVLGHSMLFKVTAADTIDVTPSQALHMIYSGKIADGLEIIAAYVSPGDTFTTWAINTRTGATTEYNNYNFNSFAQMGHKYLGATDDGLYELNGDTDDTADIIAHIKSGFAQFAGSRFTLFKAAYLGMRGTGEFVLKLVSGDGTTYNYTIVGRDMETAKVQLGKGLRARYFAFELISTGQDFDLESVEFIPLVADRRV